MRWFSFIIVLLIATLLEAGNLLNLFAIGSWTIRPGVLVTLLVYYALTCRASDAISCAFILGLAADLASGLLGPHMICYGIVGLLLSSMGQMLTMKQALHKSLFVFLTFMVTETGAYWLQILKIQESQPNFYSSMFLTGLYSAIICPLIWSVLSSLSGWSKIRPSKSHRTYR